MTKSKKNSTNTDAETPDSQGDADVTEAAESAPADSPAPEAASGDDAGGGDAPSPQDPMETRFLRLQADFDNFRKRTQREKAEWTRQANESFFSELLPILDHFEMGLRTASEHEVEPGVIQGFKLVYDQLSSLIERFDLKPIDAVGQPFDPHIHEAMTHAPSEDYAADMVMAQTRRGYRFGDRLLRPAQVIVSSGPPESADVEASEPVNQEQAAE